MIKPFNGVITLFGGFVGLAILVYSIYNRILDLITGVVCVLLIAAALWIAYRKFAGKTDRGSGDPLS